MQIELEKAILSSKNLHPKTPLLVACSGGRDSMALLYALQKLQFQHIEVGHCNFQLRGQEADEDQKHVEDFCAKHQLSFHTIRFDTKQKAQEAGVSTQMIARSLRYEWLEKIRKESNLHFIVVAHHQDDQVETILLQLIQGTGIHGLKGMQAKNDKIVRPLLEVSREQINEYVQINGIAFRDDSSNDSTYYKRNFIRHEIAPLLSKINTNYLQELSDFGQRMAETEFLFNEQVQKIRKKVLKDWKEGHQLYFEYLLQHPACDTLFHELLTPFGLSKDQIKEVLQTVKGLKKKNPSGQTFYSEQYRFILDKKSIFILPQAVEISSIQTYDQWPGQIIFNELKIDVRLQPIAKVNMHQSPRHAYLDADKIDFPIQIRYPETGDYFYPFGLGKAKNPEKAGKKKLSKFFKDIKLSVAERERTPVIKSGEKVLWVVNHRIDDRFKVTENTKNVVVLLITKGYE